MHRGHYNNIDTNWDDPKGWAKYTSPLLNTLHPITGNLVETAARGDGKHIYKEQAFQGFVRKADERIKRILETSDKHDQSTFKVENYSEEVYARIAGYARNLMRIFSLYYQTGNEDCWQNKLQCSELNVGQLGNILSEIDQKIEDKIIPLCGDKAVRQDIQNLLTLMNLLERDDRGNGPALEDHSS